MKEMDKKKQIKYMENIIDLYTETLSESDIRKAAFSEQLAERLYYAGCRKYSENIIELPCNEGTVVYEIVKNCDKCPYYKDSSYSDWCECTLDDTNEMFETDFDKDCFFDIRKTRFSYSMIHAFGKTVFLSREEAEKMLVIQKGGK